MVRGKWLEQQLGMEGLNRWKYVRVHSPCLPSRRSQKRSVLIFHSAFSFIGSITEASEIAATWIRSMAGKRRKSSAVVHPDVRARRKEGEK